ncbi:MAG TPA: glycosyltransferase [Xanthomonadales bacterium]|nr:glycosyltransferase [Xanthomonadales bacterium]
MIARRFEATASPRASVIVLVYSSAAYVEAALRSVLETTDPRFPYEVIVVLNGARRDVAAKARRSALGARVIESEANLGFGGGCNLGAANARAPYLVFLNDDVTVRTGWLEELVATADARPDAGAVGSRILNADGTVQEAGSVIFADGSTMPVGRGLPAATPRYRALRKVDYCSACSLLVRRGAFEAVGGFDLRYFPAYYEDVDLALKLREAGWSIVYQPASELVHVESTSTTSDFKSYLFRRNGRTFRRMWSPALAAFESGGPHDAASVARAITRARGTVADVLVVDDRLPDAGLGSGYGRLAELCRDLADGPYAVTFYSTSGGSSDRFLGECGVEILDGDLAAWIRDPATRIDVAVISRPHNWERAAALIRRYHPDAALVYDAEALFHRRIRQQLELERDGARRATLEREFRAAYDLEGKIARMADHLVCVSLDEEKALRSFAPHTPLDHVVATASDIVTRSDGFGERRPHAVFIAGWMAGPGSPNVDALRWFAGEVAPLIAKRAPEAVTLVTGGNPPDEVLRLRSAGVRVVGYVDDLAATYAAARVAIAPIRFGAGVKIKTIEAVQHGVPVVATTTGAEGIELDDPECVAIHDDPAGFAGAVVRLLRDEAAWTRAHEAACRQAERWRTAPHRSWRDIIDDVVARKASAAAASAVPGEPARARGL